MNTPRDNNRINVGLGVKSTDGVTLVSLNGNITYNSLLSDSTTVPSDFGTTDAKRDENFVPAFMAVSSADGITPVAVYIDSSTGKLLMTT